MKMFVDSRSLRILLVDDDESIRHSLGFYFRKKKVAFLSFAIAEDALDYLQDHQTDLVITDFSLPGLNGLQFIQKLNEISPGIMKILITAYGNFDIAVEAIRLGVHDFIQKPFNTETLESIIGNVLHKMEAERAGELIDGQEMKETKVSQRQEILELSVGKISHTIKKL